MSQFLVCILFRSCLRLVAFLFAFLFVLLFSFSFLFLFLSDFVSTKKSNSVIKFVTNSVTNKFCYQQNLLQILFGDNLAYWKNLGGSGFSRPLNISYLFV